MKKVLSVNLKDKWINALLSGKFKQGEGNLKFNGRYCCLGVLCEISGKKLRDTKDSARFKDGKRYYDFTEEIIGLTMQDSLIQMNDSGSTFKTIAEYIKENL